MRLAAVAVASLLIVVAIPSAPVVEAASTQFPGTIFAFQNVGDPSPTILTPASPY